jgi:hypothetical protein
MPIPEALQLKILHEVRKRTLKNYEEALRKKESASVEESLKDTEK